MQCGIVTIGIYTVTKSLAEFCGTFGGFIPRYVEEYVMRDEEVILLQDAATSLVRMINVGDNF